MKTVWDAVMSVGELGWGALVLVALLLLRLMFRPGRWRLRVDIEGESE